MKRFTLAITLMISLLASNVVNAQDAATTKGDWILDFGVGVGGGYYNGYNPTYNGNKWNYTRSNSRLSLPTLSISLQKAFWDDITIGGQISFNAFVNEHDYQQNDGYYQHSKYAQTSSYFTARGEYHFNRLIGLDKKFDLYAGVLAGFQITINKETERYEGWGTGQPGTWRNDYGNSSSVYSGPTGGLFGGFRYYFKDRMAVYGELGWAITNVRVGLAWRL